MSTQSAVDPIPTHSCPKCLGIIMEEKGEQLAKDEMNTLLRTECENCGHTQYEVRWGEFDGMEFYGSRMVIPSRSLSCHEPNCDSASIIKETPYNRGRETFTPCAKHMTDHHKTAAKMIANR